MAYNFKFVKSRVLAEGTAVDDLLHPDRILMEEILPRRAKSIQAG
jgi:UDP-glucose 6-dehydrogenase